MTGVTFPGKMKKMMLDDRLFDRVKHKEMIILDATSRELAEWKVKREKHLRRAFKAGRWMEGLLPLLDT